jgi:hypothetical protein
MGGTKIFVAEKVVPVFVPELVGWDAVQQVDNKAAGSGGRVEDLDVGCGDGEAELFFQHFIDAGTHEIDDLLRCVDDAKCVGLLDGEALEEALVDCVEEMLTLRPAFNASGRSFDGDVEAIQRLQEFFAVNKWIIPICINCT